MSAVFNLIQLLHPEFSNNNGCIFGWTRNIVWIGISHFLLQEKKKTKKTLSTNDIYAIQNCYIG